MIEEPAIELHARPSDQWSCDGQAANEFGSRVIDFARTFCRVIPEPERPTGIAFELKNAPAAHSGLGSGTQVSLATAAAIYALAGIQLPSPRQLAIETGRGLRSAIGCHGFYEGGLLFEGGKGEAEPLSELQCRVDLPDAWRFVLVRPQKLTGIAGSAEGRLFDLAPDHDVDHERSMSNLARDTIIPAAFVADFERFSAGIFRYGCLAGESFAFAQGDIFSSPETRLHVEDLRRRGVVGVGQSSWGPTVFALAKDLAEAERLAGDLRESSVYDDCEVWVSAARNRGAEIHFGASIDLHFPS
jgi:beta-ribofuranosylaminobenzene 5'-phosphate synthase